MIVWPAKDPAEVLDYTWEPPLDSGDTIASFSATETGVTKDSGSKADTIVTLWLSGGTDGETATIALEAVTAGGRTFREIAVLPVFDRASELLALFRLTYGAFAAVPDGTIGYWLANAGAVVTDGWAVGDRDPAKLALAAHNLALNGYGTSGGAVGELAAMGVTGFKSASMSVNFAEGAVSARASGGYAATRYGKAFLTFLRRNRGSPMLVGCV